MLLRSSFRVQFYISGRPVLKSHIPFQLLVYFDVNWRQGKKIKIKRAIPMWLSGFCRPPEISASAVTYCQNRYLTYLMQM